MSTQSHTDYEALREQIYPFKSQDSRGQRNNYSSPHYNRFESHDRLLDSQFWDLELSSYGEPRVFSSGGGSTNWGTYAAGALFTTEDIYNNFAHNHTTYHTTQGLTKNIYKTNGAIRSARAAQFAKASNVVKWLGTVGSVFVVAVSAYNIADDIHNNRSVSGWDIADGSVGSVGLASGVLSSAGIISNPVGWGIGACSALYGWTRLWFDLGTKYGPSTWYGDNDYKWFE